MSKKESKKTLRGKKKSVKDLSPTTAASSTASKSVKKSEQELFKYEGKFYAVGSIVSVGYGPYLVKKKRQGRKKKVKLIPEAEVIIPEVEEHHDENVNAEGDEEEGFNEYGADKPEIIEGSVGSEEDDGEGIINPPQSAPKPKRKKPVYEHELIFKEADVEILEGEAKAIAKEMGLPYKKSKLVTEPVKYKVVEYDLRYKGYDKFIVAKDIKSDGSVKLYLKPYSPPRVDKIEVFDGDYLPPPVPQFVTPMYTEKSNPPEKYKKYTDSLRLGDRITFTLTESKEVDMEGIILKVTDSTFDIITSDGKGYHRDIEYKNAQNLRFKGVPEEYIGKNTEKGEIRIGKKSYFVDKKTIVSKGNLLAIQSRKAPYRYAEFTIAEPKTEHLEGIIMDYGETGFVVSVIKKGMVSLSETVEVSYSNPSIVKIGKRPEIRDLKSGKINVAEDYLHLSIETSTRINATKQLFQVLSDLLNNSGENDFETKSLRSSGYTGGTVYESPIDTDERLEKLSKNINWAFANSKLETWNDYYGKQLNQYVVSALYESTFEKAPSFLQESLDEYKASVNPILIIEGLVYTFGDIFDGSAARCLSMMNSKAKEDRFQPTIIDIAIRRELTKLSNEELEDTHNYRLAKMIAHIIGTTLKTNPPPNPTSIEIRMKNAWTMEQLHAHIPTKAEKKAFDNKYAKELKLKYDVYEKEWKEAKETKREYKSLRKILEKEYNDRYSIQQTVPRLRLLSVDGRQLSSKGMELADEVSMLEEKIFIEVNTSSQGSTNEKYLQKIYKLIMFLTPSDVIGKYAKFFRSKITSGMYEVSQLDAATQFHMFPEFFANTDITDNEFFKGMREIELSMNLDVIDFIDIYMLNNPPRVRDVTYGSKFMWDNYVKEPSKSCGGMRMKVGVSYRGAEDAENYDCKKESSSSRGGSDVYVCKAKLEPITDDDLILCYDEKLRKFTCASINDVLYALWDEDQGNEPINPMTDKPYGDDFMQRMRDRYEDIYDKKLSEGGFVKRVIKFRATDDRLLFGGSESEEVIY